MSDETGQAVPCSTQASWDRFTPDHYKERPEAERPVFFLAPWTQEHLDQFQSSVDRLVPALSNEDILDGLREMAEDVLFVDDPDGQAQALSDLDEIEALNARRIAELAVAAKTNGKLENEDPEERQLRRRVDRLERRAKFHPGCQAFRELLATRGQRMRTMYALAPQYVLRGWEHVGVEYAVDEAVGLVAFSALQALTPVDRTTLGVEALNRRRLSEVQRGN